MSFISILMIGLLLGVKHAMEPDHVIAVSNIVVQTKKVKSSLLVGFIWGVGHTLTLLIIGLLLMVFKMNISKDLAIFLEIVVGFMLIFLGIKTFIISKNDNGHHHYHEVEDKNNKLYLIKSAIIGAIHGISGSAAMTLLIMATADTIGQASIYILFFGVGTAIGMLICTICIGTISQQTKRWRKSTLITVVTGCISIVFGIYYIYTCGIELLS